MADFPARHIGPDEADEAAMLRALGVGTLEELAAETVPAESSKGTMLPAGPQKSVLTGRRCANSRATGRPSSPT